VDEGPADTVGRRGGADGAAAAHQNQGQSP
jgi:hypothetical protein